MVKQFHLLLDAYPRGFHLVTNQILSAIGQLPKEGLFHLFIHHSSAGLSINENADPTVRLDFEQAFNKLVPENAPYYQHTYEGSDDMPAHIKASLVGASVSVPITDHELNLGTWQGIYLCEFRNRGGRRRVTVTLYS